MGKTNEHLDAWTTLYTTSDFRTCINCDGIVMRDLKISCNLELLPHPIYIRYLLDSMQCGNFHGYEFATFLWRAKTTTWLKLQCQTFKLLYENPKPLMKANFEMRLKKYIKKLFLHGGSFFFESILTNCLLFIWWTYYLTKVFKENILVKLFWDI